MPLDLPPLRALVIAEPIPLLADERQCKREALLTATEADLAPIAAATRRKHRPLRSAASIGLHDA